MAACAPTFVTGPIVGALADKYGAEWIITPCLLFSTLWFPFLILTGSLAGFVMFFALATVFLSCALTPVGLEVAMVARDIEGMSEIHQFAAMNIAFSTSTAIGAIVGGQMYNSSSAGWSAVMANFSSCGHGGNRSCWMGRFTFACCAVSVPVPFFFTGDPSLFWRMMGRRRKEPADRVEEAIEDQGYTSSQIVSLHGG